jgi:hypothetical protein
LPTFEKKFFFQAQFFSLKSGVEQKTRVLEVNNGEKKFAEGGMILI